MSPGEYKPLIEYMIGDHVLCIVNPLQRNSRKGVFTARIRHVLPPVSERGDERRDTEGAARGLLVAVPRAHPPPAVQVGEVQGDDRGAERAPSVPHSDRHAPRHRTGLAEVHLHRRAPQPPHSRSPNLRRTTGTALPLSPSRGRPPTLPQSPGGRGTSPGPRGRLSPRRRSAQDRLLRPTGEARRVVVCIGPVAGAGTKGVEQAGGFGLSERSRRKDGVLGGVEMGKEEVCAEWEVLEGRGRCGVFGRSAGDDQIVLPPPSQRHSLLCPASLQPLSHAEDSLRPTRRLFATEQLLAHLRRLVRHGRRGQGRKGNVMSAGVFQQGSHADRTGAGDVRACQLRSHTPNLPRIRPQGTRPAESDLLPKRPPSDHQGPLPPAETGVPNRPERTPHPFQIGNLLLHPLHQSGRGLFSEGTLLPLLPASGLDHGHEAWPAGGRGQGALFRAGYPAHVGTDAGLD